MRIFKQHKIAGRTGLMTGDLAASGFVQERKRMNVSRPELAEGHIPHLFLMLVTTLIMVLATIKPVSGQSLDSLYKEALETNPGVQAQYQKFEALMQKSAAVSGMPSPQLSLGYFINPIETRVGPQRAQIGLSQQFPWFGTLKAKESAVAYQAEAQFQKFEEAKLKLYADLSRAYYPLVEWSEKLKILESEKALLKELRQQAIFQQESGNASSVDVIRADLLIDDINTEIDILKAERSALQSQLSELLNKEETFKIEPTDSLNRAFSLSGSDRESMKNHPAVKRYEQEQKAFAEQENAATKAGLPQIGVGINYFVVTERSDAQLPKNGQDALLPQLSISLPIYRKQYRAARKEAIHLQKAAEFEAQSEVNQLQSELDNVLFAIDREMKLIALYKSKIGKAEMAVELLLDQYQNGQTDYEEVLRLQSKLFDFKLKELESTKKLNIKQSELIYLTNDLTK